MIPTPNVVNLLTYEAVLFKILFFFDVDLSLFSYVDLSLLSYVASEWSRIRF